MPILERLQNHFQSYVWKHVLSMLVGLMLLRKAKTLTALQHRESLPTLSRTLNVYEWPLEELIATRRSVITQALKKYRQRRGRPHLLYLILDDTVVPKRGKKLPALGFHFSSSEDRVVHGWDWVFAAVRVGSLTVPWDWRGYVNERFVEEEDFQKRTELACELIRSFEPPVPGRVIVLVDSVYCCAEVIRAAHQRGFPAARRWATGLGCSGGDGRTPARAGDSRQGGPSRTRKGTANGHLDRPLVRKAADPAAAEAPLGH